VANPNDASTSNPDYQADLQHISELRANRDFTGLNLFADAIKKKYANHADKTLEYRTLAVVANAFGSVDFGVKLASEQPQAAGVLALFILRADDVPLDVSANMLGQLRWKLSPDYQSTKVSKEDWVKERTEYAHLCLGTLARFNDAIGPNFDPHEQFFNDNGLVPPSPDPNVNAQRAAARKAATQKRNAYVAVWGLYRRRDMLIYDHVRGLAYEYSQNPQDTQELQDLFKQYQIDPAIQSKVLAAVVPVTN